MTVKPALCLNNATNDLAYSPLHADYQGPGFDIRCCFAPTNWFFGSATQGVVGRTVTAASFGCDLGPGGASGYTRIDISADGSRTAGAVGFFTGATDIPVPAAHGMPYIVRWVYLGTNPIRAAVFLKAPTLDSDDWPVAALAECESNTGWSLHWETSGAFTFLPFPGNSALEVGRSTGIDGVDSTLQGRVFAMVMKDSENGTTVANPDFTAQTPGTLDFLDGVGKQWFMSGGAHICYEGVPLVGGHLRQKQRSSEQDGLRATRGGRNSYQ